MNRLLTSTLTALNIVYALLIILGCVIYGADAGAKAGVTALVGGGIGLLFGIFLAAMVCGLVAFLTLIEEHLAYLVKCADYQNEMAKLQYEATQTRPSP